MMEIHCSMLNFPQVFRLRIPQLGFMDSSPGLFVQSLLFCGCGLLAGLIQVLIFNILYAIFDRENVSPPGGPRVLPVNPGAIVLLLIPVFGVVNFVIGWFIYILFYLLSFNLDVVWCLIGIDSLIIIVWTVSLFPKWLAEYKAYIDRQKQEGFNRLSVSEE